MHTAQDWEKNRRHRDHFCAENNGNYTFHYSKIICQMTSERMDAGIYLVSRLPFDFLFDLREPQARPGNSAILLETWSCAIILTTVTHYPVLQNDSSLLLFWEIETLIFLSFITRFKNSLESNFKTVEAGGQTMATFIRLTTTFTNWTKLLLHGETFNGESLRWKIPHGAIILSSL